MDTMDDSSSLGMSQCSSNATNHGTATTTGDASTVDNSLTFRAGDDDDEFSKSIDDNCTRDVDGFKLLTQANDHYLYEDSDTPDKGNSNVGPSSSSSEESESDSDESSDEDEGDRGPMARVTPIQVRRARNIRRNELFLQKFRSDRSALFGNSGSQNNQSTAKTKSNADKLETITESDKNASAPELNELAAARRGMLLPVSSKRIRAERIKPLHFGSLSKELQLRYPNRSTQIVDLVSRLSKTVQKSHFAWEVEGSDYTHFSEAGCQHKLSFQSPLLVTGPAGSAKSAIVRDALEEIKCIDRGVAVAYADFAGSDVSSLSAVLNIAYKKLHECYELLDRLAGETDKKRRRKHTYLDDFEFIEDDEDSGEEELLERRRKGKRRKAATGGEMLRRTRRNATQPMPAYSSSINASGLNDDPAVKTTRKSKQDATSVALFGRAVTELIQEGASRKKGVRRPRTAFLVLDNVDRILEWKRQSLHPLSQLFMLSGVTGLEVIFISRCSLYAHTSPIHKQPIDLFRATRPFEIRFEPYTNAKAIKHILLTAHVRSSITGKLTSRGQSNLAAAVRRRGTLGRITKRESLTSILLRNSKVPHAGFVSNVIEGG